LEIEPFGVEEWMNAYEEQARFNVAETCVESMTVGELLDLSGGRESFLEEFLSRKLTYGEIPGSFDLRGHISRLYDTQDEGNVLVTHGGIGANFLALFTLVGPGDRVVVVKPTYQQLYSVPKAFGADVRMLDLRPENDFLPDLDDLHMLAGDRCRLIVLNNPNNPTGALMDAAFLKEVVRIAERTGAWILCDEVYRGLEHDPGEKTPSVVDLSERAVATGSLSKVFSLAGLRLGWVAGPRDFIKACFSRRDYTTISCGMIDEMLAIRAFSHRDKIRERNLPLVRRNAAILDRWVGAEKGLSYVRPRAGTTAFIHYDYPILSEEFCKALFDYNGAFIVPGKAFDFEGWFRIGYSCATETLEEGLSAISSYMRTL
jgi:aspartate/methionine/tyrosine aminotransferase